MTDYAYLVADSESETTEHLRIRIPPDLVAAFSATAKRKNLSKQGVFERLLRFWLAQEDVAQSMIVGQVTPQEDLVALVLRRLARNEDYAEVGEVEGEPSPPVPATEQLRGPRDERQRGKPGNGRRG